MRIIFVGNVEKFAERIRPKPQKQNKTIVESIISQVQKKGDSALRDYEKKFSGASIKSLQVSKKEISDAYSQVSTEEISAIKLSKKNLTTTETAVKRKLKKINIKLDGIKISKDFIPIESVGCYVPGGMARYPSSAIMSVVPAKVSGVRRIVVVSPPNKEGKIDPLTIVAADLCGATEIYKTGGAQAVAALAFGTKSIEKVEKIVGPGGSFVTIAKSLVSDTTSIDMVAGPTELGIIADNTANPDYIAEDLISQAEHSKDTFCYLITTSKTLAEKVKPILGKKIKNSERYNIVKYSLEKNGFIALCRSEKEAVKLANFMAPEHLEIITKQPKTISKKIHTPGLILIGENTPSSASDYLLGSNHILPTNGFGKVRGSLSVLDFMKLGTQIEASRSSLEKLSKPLYHFTKAEGLSSHYEAVRSRIK